MERSISRKRPWLAALLGVLATGLGHLYLRRWKRAVGWLAAVFGVTALFVDPAALEALPAGNADVLSVAPLLVVAGLSVVDAYLLAHARNANTSRAAAPDGQPVHCRNCGRELDPDIEFCHWCTTEVGQIETERRENAGGNGDP